MISDVRLAEILSIAATHFDGEIGYKFDARRWGRNYICVEMEPRKGSKFHIRVPCDYAEQPLAALRAISDQIDRHH